MFDFIFIFQTPKPTMMKMKKFETTLQLHRVSRENTLPEGRSVVGNDDHLGFALSESFQGLSVSKNIFPRFHHQGKP